MSDRHFTFAPLVKSQWTYIILFAMLGLLGIINHSMWRDEMNVWLIAKYSHNLADFWNNIRYDRGHPGLWHLLVAIAFHIVDNPIAMQILHWLIGSSAVLLLWLFAPFTQRQKILFSFGYLPFYQNLLISRNYALGMLLLFGICTAFNSRYKTYFGLACLLALLANSNIYGLFIAFSLTITLILELLLNDLQRKKFLHQKYTSLKLSPKIDIIGSGIVILSSFFLSAYTILPPAQVVTKKVLTEISTKSNLEQFLVSLGRLLGGYTLLIPNSARLLDLVVCGIIAIVLFVIFFTSFIDKILPLFFFTFSTLQILAFSYFSFPGRGPRHFGHFYFILIAALWIASYYKPQKWLVKRTIFWQRIKIKKVQSFTLMLVLYIQFFGGLFGFTHDVFIPYSASRQTVNYIKDNQLADEFIVASRDVNMASISGYFGKKLYYPERNNFGSFSLFLKHKRQDLTHEQVLQKTEKLLLKNPNNNVKRILLILHKELKTTHPNLEITQIKKFKYCMLSSERYYLHWVSLKNAGGSPNEKISTP